MVQPHERVKKKKFRRTARGKSKRFPSEKKTGKRTCALTRQALSGVPHGKRKSEVRKLSKSQRRPTAVLGGVLSSKARRHVMEESIKVKTKVKSLQDVELKVRGFVNQVIKKLE